MQRTNYMHQYNRYMKFKYRQDILHGNVTENLLLLMYPILIWRIFQQLYQMADAIVVGQFAKSSALAIVGGFCKHDDWHIYWFVWRNCIW